MPMTVAAAHRVPSWFLLAGLGGVKLFTAWIYDARILTPEALQSMRASSKLPPELAGLLSSSHLTLMHYGTTLFMFVVAMAFLACCLQLALLALGEEVDFEMLFRATMVASIPLAIESSVKAIEILRAGGGLLGLRSVRPTPSLASLLPSSASGSQLFLLLSMATLFEAAWCALLLLQLYKISRPSRVLAAVSIVWVSLSVGKWALLSFAIKLLT